MNGYFTDDDKFNALKVFIEPETYEAVASLIFSPPLANKYETLKKSMLSPTVRPKTYTNCCLGYSSVTAGQPNY